MKLFSKDRMITVVMTLAAIAVINKVAFLQPVKSIIA